MSPSSPQSSPVGRHQSQRQAQPQAEHHHHHHHHHHLQLQADPNPTTCLTSSSPVSAQNCTHEVVSSTTASKQLASVLSQPVVTTTAATATTPADSTDHDANQQRRRRLSNATSKPAANQFSPSHQQKPQQHHTTSGTVLAMINPDTRTHVVGELFDTERSYVESLEILIEKYMKPLKIQALVDSNLVDEIFFTIPEILQHHERFLKALQERLASDWDSSQVIGNVFIEAFTNQQIIDTYTKFINNWKNARHAIKLATQNKPAFKGFLESTSREHRNKLTLDALLIMPVQRIPRYELLIKELIKHTPVDHPDHGPLIEAQKEIHELALKIDRAEREMVHQEQLRDLEALIENQSGSIQQPNRNFIRYDLVTVATSTLTVTRKERVLFLFCDLLIMTSVKKKVSRRSNLQAAFACSDHDISLLEGNKFKLILRASLDQVNIRCDNNEQTQLWQQQQQLHEQELFALAKHKKLLDEREREFESDLLVLQQMELLLNQLVSADKEPLASLLAQSTANIVGRLNNLKLQQNDCELESANLTPVAQLMQPASGQDSSPIQTSQNIARDQQQQQLLEQDHNKTDASLEFIINDEATSRDILSINSNASSRDEGGQVDSGLSGSSTVVATVATVAPPSGGNSAGSLAVKSIQPESQITPQSQTGGCQSLVVSFPSLDRRQAFIDAFLEAKRERLKQQQRRLFTHHSEHLLKSRSVASDMRRIHRLKHQDEIISQDQRQLTNTNTTTAVVISKHQLDGILSAPCAGTINRCASCSSHYNLSQKHNNGPAHHTAGSHHHHQLMHQPASHPALLHTICCHEQHNDSRGSESHCVGGSWSMKSLTDKAEYLAELPLGSFSSVASPSSMGTELAHDMGRGQMGAIAERNKTNSVVVALLENDLGKSNQILMLKFVPKFLSALPLTFLNSQHPALQPTCAVTRRIHCNGEQLSGTKTICKQQTVCDHSGQMWLCMSNGYVSHISLIEFVAKDCGEPIGTRSCEIKSGKHCYELVPVVKSGGDICKSQINCAVQVCWSISSRSLDDTLKQLADIDCDQRQTGARGAQVSSEQKLPPEVSIKSASPPVNVDQTSASKRSVQLNGDEDKLAPGRHMSHSAPAVSRTECELGGGKNRFSSASSTGPVAQLTRTDPIDVEGAKGATGSRRSANQRPSQANALHQNHQHEHYNSQDQLGCNQHLCGLSCSVACSANTLVRHRHKTTSSNQPKLLHTTTATSHQQAHTTSQHPLNHHHHHHHHHHHTYNSRHHTVSLAELRRALERQSRFGQDKDHLSLTGGHRRHYLAPPANTPNRQLKAESLDLSDGDSCRPVNLGQSGSLDQMSRGSARSNTPPMRNISTGTRTRQLRHQASLKTSAILAKLVSSAGKGSSYLKRSSGANRTTRRVKAPDANKNSSDLDDNTPDIGPDQALKSLNETKTISVESIQSMAPIQQQSNSVVSPLSSISSLNSSNSSSMTANSMCIGTPMHSSCTGLFDRVQWSASSTCCPIGVTANGACDQPTAQDNLKQLSSSREDLDDQIEGNNLRSRSATVPSRAYCEQTRPISHTISPLALANRPIGDTFANENFGYKINEIDKGAAELVAPDVEQLAGNERQFGSKQESNRLEVQRSLWLGCEDGSLLIVDCLNSSHQSGGQPQAACSDGSCGLYVDGNDLESTGHNHVACHNVHSELRLGAPVSDIVNYLDKLVFVALADGRLAVFSRFHDNVEECSKSILTNEWQLEKPQIITVVARDESNELIQQTSKLCLVDDDNLWYSYGRNIYILQISTLTLKTTIVTNEKLNGANNAASDTQLSPSIDNMKCVSQLNGVWVSFRDSPSIEFYESRNQFKLLLEMSLLDSIQRVLSCGNEIIRQHKSACLGSSSMLSVYNELEQTNLLFIGTSAGLVLILTLNHQQLREQAELEGCFAWTPQVISLRHGHSGQVRLLQLIRPKMLTGNGEANATICCDETNHKNDLILVSGGPGIDLYGPTDNQQIVHHDDSLNHLIFWAI